MDIDTIHEFYEKCMKLNFVDTHDLLNKASTKTEKDFVKVITDFVLQQKQKKSLRLKFFKWANL